MANTASDERGVPGRSLTAKFKETAAFMGGANACFYALDQALRRAPGGLAIFKYRLVAQEVAGERAVASSGTPSYAVREIAPGDPSLRHMPLSQRVIDCRFAQSAVCLGLFREDRLVAYGWFCPGPYEEDEVRCRFVPEPPGRAVWDFDIYVFPEHRMGRAFAVLWEAANRHLRAKGVGWTISRISAFNAGSLAAHERLGARRLGDAIFLRGKRFQLMLANVAPFLHLSVLGRSRPVIRLRAPAQTEPPA